MRSINHQRSRLPRSYCCDFDLSSILELTVFPRALTIVTIFIWPHNEMVQWIGDVTTLIASLVFFGKVSWICSHKYLWWAFVNPCPAFCSSKRTMPCLGDTGFNKRSGYCPVGDLAAAAPSFDIASLLSAARSKIFGALAWIRRASFRSVWQSRERYDVSDEQGGIEEQEMVSLIEPPSRFTLDRGAAEQPLQNHASERREKDL